MADGLISALILAIIQGVTEWFPISSSGHLILFERVLNYHGGLAFDVALHFGTLMAVFVYFGREITDIVRDVFTLKFGTENGKMGLFLIVASIPAAIVGYFSAGFFESVLSNLVVVAFGFGITGLFLLIASFPSTSFTRKFLTHKNNPLIHPYNVSKIKDKKLGNRNENGELSFGKAFLIGIAQALSIIPGISRSGATISSGVLLGLKEKNAMKFAFLMSIPIIFGANILAIGNQTLPSELIWATLVSFFVGLLSIHVIFKWILTKKKNFRWFGLYCLLLALGIGVWVLVF
jgi:undecaprenyl-diphosphatase